MSNPFESGSTLRLDTSSFNRTEQDFLTRDRDTEYELLRLSGLFNGNSYAQDAGLGSTLDPIEHYLTKGWLNGLEPNEEFSGSLLKPYFASVGFDEPPAVTLLTLQSAGWPIPATKAELLRLAAEVRNCELFDESYYRRYMRGEASNLDPAIHYVAVGERLGLAPSPHFDPTYYGKRHPDVSQCGLNLLLHFANNGRHEGRRGKHKPIYRDGKRPFFPERENVMVVVHDATRTGAPIVGWNLAVHLNECFNVFTVRFGDGDLIPDFEEQSVRVFGPYFGNDRHPLDLDYSLRDFLREHKLRYAIVNSAESRFIVEVLSRRLVPTVFLMHEFASYVQPVEELRAAFDWSTEIVFPARIVAEAAQVVHPLLKGRATQTIAQGMSLVPADRKTNEPVEPKELKKLISGHDDGVFTVVGAGYVQLRKGVEVFLAIAAAVLRLQPERKIQFIWVGGGFNPNQDMTYSVYLQEQLVRSGLADHFTFLKEVSDLQPVYRIADLFLLSSRLDPMPNVCIDVAVQGIPIICFRDASGVADLLLADPDTAVGVVDYLDAEAAARVIVNIAGDSSLHQEMGEATKRIGLRTFDMKAYVAKLDDLGERGGKVMQQRAADAETLLHDLTFDLDMYIGPILSLETRDEAMIRYLAESEVRGRSHEKTSLALRRPAVGFHPLAYSELIWPPLPPEVNPLADYVRRHNPKGPWQAQVLRMDDYTPPAPPVRRLRAVLHGHFYYPELASDFLDRLALNQRACDLLITTDTVEKAQVLERCLIGYRNGTVSVQVMPNLGRDIGPLVTGLAQALEKYDLIGHIHSKRTLVINDGKLGDAWRTFLWEHLIGGRYPMMDRIISSFEEDPGLGLVFPSSSRLAGWDSNRRVARDLAIRMGWSGQLPEYFDFPLGTMFWCTREALQPILALGLQWDDYPPEPVPYDGTILHSLERLVPFSTKISGRSHAVTHISGIWW